MQATFSSPDEARGILQQNVTAYRLKIDSYSQLIGNINEPGKFSRQIENCYDSVVLSKAWLGRLMGLTGQPSPYTKDGNRHSESDIEETADQAKELSMTTEYASMNYIEKVDWIRQQLGELETAIWSFFKENRMDDCYENAYKANVYTTECFTDMARARMHLGFELQRIKENDVERVPAEIKFSSSMEGTARLSGLGLSNATNDAHLPEKGVTEL